MEQIHPIFESVAELDYDLASACSELFIPEEYTFVQPSDVYTEDDAGFPPEPSELLTVVASYIEYDSRGLSQGIRSNYISIHEDPVPDAVVGDIYESYVGMLQDSFKTMQSGLLQGVPKLGEYPHSMRQFCLESTQKEDRRLVAAHLIGRTASKGALIQAIAYPRVLDDEIGLEIRDFAVSILPAMDTIRKELEESMDNEAFYQADEIFKSILRMDGRMRVIGTMAAASILPDAQIFRNGINFQNYSEN